MKTLLLLMSFILCGFVSTAQNEASAYDATVANHYFDFSLKLVRETPGFSPPVAARAFGFMGLALYEAIVPGMPEYRSTEGRILELVNLTLPEPGSAYHWPTVANNALGGILDSLFRTATQINKDSLATIREHYNSVFQSEVSQEIYDRSKTFGESIALDIFDYSRTDGGHNAFAQNFPLDYTPPTGPSYWVPFGNQTCLQPYWGNHRPFIEDDTTSTTLPVTPPEFSTDPGSPFYNNALQVYITTQNLTEDQENIALFWADGVGTITPPGHSISMLKNILIEEDANLEMASLAYAKLGIAVSDAFLACWKSKYIHNLCRPVTFIRQHIDTAWLPMIDTPPFPEYPSGHSSQSGAMAAVMTHMFGDNYSFTDNTHGNNFGGPRQFSSFQEAAEEAAISRLYGGIHFEFGNMAGLTLGTIVGTNVNLMFDQLNVSTSEVNPIAANLILYPNPATDLISIKAIKGLTGQASYTIFDITGRRWIHGLMTEDITRIPIHTLVSGLYFVHVDSPQPATYRFMKS